jgi:hypothetical protein
LRNRKIDFIAGLLVGLGAPLFSIAVALEAFPVLQDVGDVPSVSGPLSMQFYFLLRLILSANVWLAEF